MKKFKDYFTKHPTLIYPAVLIIILIILTACRISGTSIGIYNGFLNGGEKDPNLIFGQPQSIRSDEWLVNTQITISQSQLNYPYINSNFTEGKNMSVLFDTPYREWSAFFKPQNFSFFVLPLEYAFAFKWWFMLFALIIATYFFVLKFLPGKLLIAIVISVLFACSPFIAWWYLNGTIAPLTYGLLIVLVSISIIERKKIHFLQFTASDKLSVAVKICTLSYLLICFALLLYPPFQIPVALGVAAFLIGYLLNRLADAPNKKRFLRLIIFPFFVAIIITGGICATYLTTRSDVVKSIANTVYPGKRDIPSGGYDVKELLVTYLQPQLQREGRGAKYDKNQSESSSFIVLPLFFTIPALAALILRYRAKRKIDWILVGLLSCVMIFFLHLFVPQASPLSRIFFLHYVPHDRLTIGLGFIAILLITYLIYVFAKWKVKFTRNLRIAIIIYSIIFFLISVWAGFETSAIYPDFISNKMLIILLAAIVASGLFLILFNRVRIGLFILTLFSIGSILFVNPLYIGLGPIYNSKLTQKIQQLSEDSATWAAADNIVIENLPQLSGRHAITGVSGYPSNAFWRENSEVKDEAIYNRYAHILLTSDNSESLRLLSPDLFIASGDCGRKVNNDINYVVSTAAIQSACYKLVDTLKYPSMNFYFYRLSH